jgi:lysophospholipase L1-like esterase
MQKAVRLSEMRMNLGLFAALGLMVFAAGSLAAGAQQTAAPATPALEAKAALTPQEITALERYKEHTEIMLKDWPNLKRFYADDVALSAPAAGEHRIVFMGDSITEGWVRHGVPADPPIPGTLYINRGISGQTTPQMVLRFRQDVIDLKPNAVVILAGVNDIAGNTGDMTPEQTEGNLQSMAELAHGAGIRVVMCSIMPAFDFPWKPGREPAPKVVALNKWIKEYAASHEAVYVDFYSAMVDQRGGLPAKLSKDGVHPNPAGYAIMTPLVEAGITQVLGEK